ncbi:hypothetical protein ACFPRL_34770 [Pseudoclavibacter helvolus]
MVGQAGAVLPQGRWLARAAHREREAAPGAVRCAPDEQPNLRGLAHQRDEH